MSAKFRNAEDDKPIRRFLAYRFHSHATHCTPRQTTPLAIIAPALEGQINLHVREFNPILMPDR
jgi:hypothetical protein